MIWILVAFLAASDPEDWPQFLGPGRDGVYRGPALSIDWPSSGPKLVWKRGVGQGFAGPVVASSRVLLFHRVEGREVVEALEAGTGKAVWRADYGTRYRDDFGFDEGPRAAPVVADGVVVTFGAEGVLSALDLASGKLLWRVDTRERFGVPKAFFGAAGSPLVEDGRVIANVGGKNAGIVAVDVKTGEVLWTATEDEASYSSPTSGTFGGRKLALVYTRSGLVALEPGTGEVKHSFRWRSRSRASVNAAVPLVAGDVVFLSASYGTGAVALRLKDEGPEALWSSDDALSNHYATSVHRDAVLYGFHGRQEYGQSLNAIELLTGKVLWSEDGFGAGTVTLAADRLFLVRESGELVVAEASPGRFRVLARARLLPGTVRAHPAVANGFLYVRNEKELAAFDLRGQ
jgi:outer membrane protein assembly factor BamB